jgi:hypothetical protein
MSTPACDEFESDDCPSVGPQRIQSAGWIPAPSPSACRGPHPTIVEEPQQDFSALGIVQAQNGAELVHKEALVVVLYNLMKTRNQFDLTVIAQNGIEKQLVNFQREGSLWTFLMQAAYWNNESVARWLFTHGADPFVRNASNQTALDVAMNERNINVAEIVRLRMGELEAAKRAVGSARSTKPIDIAAATKAQQLH